MSYIVGTPMSTLRTIKIHMSLLKNFCVPSSISGSIRLSLIIINSTLYLYYLPGPPNRASITNAIIRIAVNKWLLGFIVVLLLIEFKFLDYLGQKKGPEGPFLIMISFLLRLHNVWYFNFLVVSVWVRCTWICDSCNCTWNSTSFRKRIRN